MLVYYLTFLSYVWKISAGDTADLMSGSNIGCFQNYYKWN